MDDEDPTRAATAKARAGMGDGPALAGGILLALVGSWFAFQALGYQAGTLRRMGPGFFPLVLGIVLAGLGVLLALRGMRSAQAALARPAWRGLAAAVAGMVAFALMIERFGIVPSTFVLVLLTSLGEKRRGLVGPLVLAVIVSLAAVLVFRWGLNIRIEPFRWRP